MDPSDLTDFEKRFLDRFQKIFVQFQKSNDTN